MSKPTTLPLSPQRLVPPGSWKRLDEVTIGDGAHVWAVWRNDEDAPVPDELWWQLDTTGLVSFGGPLVPKSYPPQKSRPEEPPRPLQLSLVASCGPKNAPEGAEWLVSPCAAAVAIAALAMLAVICWLVLHHV